jgi:hypothetical protein
VRKSCQCAHDNGEEDDAAPRLSTDGGEIALQTKEN